METTPNGIPYEWWLDSPRGARFVLHPTKEHARRDIVAAKAWLRFNHDVLSISVEKRYE